jgi:hypothetical protein
MTPAVEAVAIPFIVQFLDDAGHFRADDVIEQAAVAMLDELEQLQQASHGLRSTLEISR